MVQASESMIEHNLGERGLLVCPECDFLMRTPVITPGERVCCGSCGHELYRHREAVVQRSLALVMAALVLYVPANFLPIMQLNVLGRSAQGTLWEGVKALYANHTPVLAVVVLLCSMAIPLIKLLCQLIVLLCIRWRAGCSYGLLLYRLYHHLREWGMLEVYLMGVLVSIVKLSSFAGLSLGLGLGCFVAMLLAQLWLEVTMSPQQIWAALSQGGEHARD